MDSIAAGSSQSQGEEVTCLKDEIVRLQAELKKKNSTDNGGPEKRVYREVRVLIAKWEFGDIDVDEEINELNHVFTRDWGFDVQYITICDDDSAEDVAEKVEKKVEGHQSSDILWIYYYAGHGILTEDDNKTLLWCPTIDDDFPEISSIPVQKIFENLPSDAILLYDCCHSAITSTTERIGTNGTVTEAIAACGYDTTARVPGVGSFTYSLTQVLIDHRKEEILLRELFALTLDHLKCTEDTTCPVHTTLTYDKGRDIVLRSLRKRGNTTGKKRKVEEMTE